LISFIKFEVLHPIHKKELFMLADQIQTELITLTPSAVQAINELLEKRDLEGYALRIFVSGGGCSGLQYGMALDNNIQTGDVTAELDGVKVVIDEVSINYMRGSTVDYVDDLMASGFKIDNPNAIASCGCGNSFDTGSDGNTQGSSSGCSSCY
jgi:iron-sulfur cluster assembly protein